MPRHPKHHQRSLICAHNTCMAMMFIGCCFCAIHIRCGRQWTSWFQVHKGSVAKFSEVMQVLNLASKLSQSSQV